MSLLIGAELSLKLAQMKSRNNAMCKIVNLHPDNKVHEIIIISPCGGLCLIL